MKSSDYDIDSISSQLDQAEALVKREAVFAEKANELFEKNIKAFQKYFPDIAERFVNFTPNEKFQLLVNEDGTGNIIDYHTNVPFYNDTPLQQVATQVDDNYKNPILGQINYSLLEHLENLTNFVHIDTMVAVGKVFNNVTDKLALNTTVSHKIPSMIIFGIGLGYHLKELQTRSEATYVTIFEPNEDYFFGSLFCFDWAAYITKLDESGSFLYLGIGDEEDTIYQTIYDRVKEIGPYSVSNSFFYQHYPSVKVASIIERIKENFHQFFMGWGFFDDALLSISHTLGVMDKAPAIIQPHHDLPDKMAQYPVFIVANGPSLDDDIEQIKRMKDKAIIVACNSATTALLANDIVPDFHVALERTKSTADFLEHFIPEQARQKINLLVLNVMYPEVLDLFGWTGVGIKGHEAGTTLFQLGEYYSRGEITTTLGYCNPLVGNTALSFFCSLGSKNVYLFGLDKGYVDTNHHHSKSSYYYEEDGDEKYEPIKMGAEFSVEGNFVPSVITEPFLYTGKEQVERLLLSFRGQGFNIYNCSNGVKMEHTFPLRSADIMLEESTYDKSDVIDYIKTHSFKDYELAFDLNSLLYFDKFQQICETMVDILSEKASTREEALPILFKHLHYLNSFMSGGGLSHLYLILQGEAWYVNSVLLAILYNYGDSEEIMPYYQEALDVWIDFLEKAPDMYRERWNVLSDYGFDYNE
ncbi:motility associated factor glycosyltransferase family protein [Thalassotalea eurytherma]|uniref:DUF115 domain-containing protein n=1 Tax=Thalassotalea eurytherma TaxID=1144278 RepID=A0ABQ6H4P5_9GAMM|nr:6-hydroxymethylpterin diphosphokinase MptE-like protein [Thalassotalea eurytherma]GLX83128.1 hypothetical protein theurythT_25800 [Thalassotalea eurytherma]